MLFSILKKCDITDPNIPQEVKDFYEQVNRDSLAVKKTQPFDLHVSEDNNNYYCMLLHLEHTYIGVADFGTHDIKEATVDVTFHEETPKQHIYAYVGNIPRDNVCETVDKIFDLVIDFNDNPDVTFLDMIY